MCVWLCIVPQLQRVSEESPELLAQSGDLLVGITAQFANSSQRIARQATTILVTLGNAQFSVPTGQWAMCYQIHPLTASELSPFFWFRPCIFLFLSCFNKKSFLFFPLSLKKKEVRVTSLVRICLSAEHVTCLKPTTGFSLHVKKDQKSVHCSIFHLMSWNNGQESCVS